MSCENWILHFDLNKAYANIIRVLYPSLRKKHVVVMSNNDGCNICYSPGENLPKLPIKMGTVIFEIEDLIRKHDVELFSVNFPLICDFSQRFRSIMETHLLRVEHYSIDEEFAEIYASLKVVKEIAQAIREDVDLCLDLPLSCGIARTKTLAKVATRHAKNYKAFNGVCAIGTEKQRIRALELTKIGDVWGIGPEYSKKLLKRNITNAYEFTINMQSYWVRKLMTVSGLRTWLELQGTPCIELELIEPEKESITVSRSFGWNVTEYDSVAAALSTFTAMGAAKLRNQKSKAKSISVFIHTNRYKGESEQMNVGLEIPLPVATSSSIELTEYMKMALKAMFREGLYFKQAGIMLDDICKANAVQYNIFDSRDRAREDMLMDAQDYINNKFGSGTVKLMAEMMGTQNWGSRQAKMTPAWTTRPKEFPHAYVYDTKTKSE